MNDRSPGLYAPSLVEVTTRQLREEILSGELAPGQRLIEDQIRLRFSISRAPLREALRSLAQQGLVEHLPRRGMRVTDLTATDIDQLFGIRRALERHAIECAFPMADSPATDRLGEVRQWLDQMRQADADDDDLRKDDAHRAFHAAIVSLARKSATRSRAGADPAQTATPDGAQPAPRGAGHGPAAASTAMNGWSLRWNPMTG